MPVTNAAYAETVARASALEAANAHLIAATQEFLDAERTFRAMANEPTSAWVSAEARYRQARTDVLAAIADATI